MDSELDLAPLRSARRRVFRPLVVVMVMALGTLEIAHSALERPLGFDAFPAWFMLLALVLAVQLFAVRRWSMWAQTLAKLLDQRGAPGLDMRRHATIHNLIPPTSAIAELLALVNATSTWAGEWRQEQVAPLPLRRVFGLGRRRHAVSGAPEGPVVRGETRSPCRGWELLR